LPQGGALLRRLRRPLIPFEFANYLRSARLKPWFPKEVACDPDTAALVSSRWREYFPDGGVEMGDAEAAHLTR
jgi:hypothetical protein